MAELNKDTLQNAIKEATPWDVGTTIHRTNPLPIDMSSIVFIDPPVQPDSQGIAQNTVVEAAKEAANAATSYPGQIISAVETNFATGFIFQPGEQPVEEIAFKSYVDRRLENLVTYENGASENEGILTLNLGALAQKLN